MSYDVPIWIDVPERDFAHHSNVSDLMQHMYVVPFEVYGYSRLCSSFKHLSCLATLLKNAVEFESFVEGRLLGVPNLFVLIFI